MDYKKSKAPVNTVTRNIFENREQIEISRYYEKLPKPTLLATQEFVEDKIYWRDPMRETSSEEN